MPTHTAVEIALSHTLSLDLCCRMVLERSVDADNQPCVLMKRFALLKHHIAAWEFYDCVGIEIAERSAFFNRLVSDKIRAKAAASSSEAGSA